MPNEHTIEMLVNAGEWFPLNIGTFELILTSDNGELKLNHKLKPMHLNMPTGARTNVRLAAQTLSRTTALSLQYLHPELAPQAEAIITTNDVRYIIFLLNTFLSCYIGLFTYLNFNLKKKNLFAWCLCTFLCLFALTVPYKSFLFLLCTLCSCNYNSLFLSVIKFILFFAVV